MYVCATSLRVPSPSTRVKSRQNAVFPGQQLRTCSTEATRREVRLEMRGKKKGNEHRHTRYRASTKPCRCPTHSTSDFDIVFVVLHQSDSEWMKRQKNTSNDDWSFAAVRFTDNLRTILIRGIPDTDMSSVQKMPVESGYSIGK